MTWGEHVLEGDKITYKGFSSRHIFSLEHLASLESCDSGFGSFVRKMYKVDPNVDVKNIPLKIIIDTAIECDLEDEEDIEEELDENEEIYIGETINWFIKKGLITKDEIYMIGDEFKSIENPQNRYMLIQASMGVMALVTTKPPTEKGKVIRADTSIKNPLKISQDEFENLCGPLRLTRTSSNKNSIEYQKKEEVRRAKRTSKKNRRIGRL